MATGFLKSLIWTVGVSLFIVTGMNLLVDPFNLFGVPSIQGLNQDKPELQKHTRMAKAHRVRVLRPRGIILGNSQAEVGLSPQHPSWPKDTRPVYNLAFSSGRIYELLRYLEHSQAQMPLHTVVLGVSLSMFDANWPTEEGFSEDRLAKPGVHMGLSGWIRDLMTTLVSADGLHASWKTVTTQDGSSNAGILENGMRDVQGKQENIRRLGGHRAAFQKGTFYALTSPGGWMQFALYGSRRGNITPLEAYRRIIELCRGQNVHLLVIISPVHAHYLEVLWQFDLWDKFENWKRQLVGIAEEYAATKVDGIVEVWDFSGYSTITLEEFPALNDATSEMQWYWEGSHYRKEVGDIVLRTILEKNGSTDTRLGGLQITTRNIEEHLLALREARAIYSTTFPNDVQEIAKMISETKPRRAAVQAKKVR